MRKTAFNFALAALVVLFGLTGVFAQKSGENSAVNYDEHLDLYAVAELFRDSDSIEKFERDLNDSSKGVNNLDLDEDGQVDFIRVVEQTKDDARFVVLQTPIGENEYQDVATIIVEKENNDYNLQIQGDEEIYGANYYVVPAQRNFGAWNVVRWLFSPSYRAYVSLYRYRYYPTWFTLRRPVAGSIYRTRVGAFKSRRNFVASRTTVARSVSKFNYRPSRSAVVVKKRTTTMTITDSRNGNDRVKQKTVVTKTGKGRKN